MKKKRLFLLTLASATFVLAGCGVESPALPPTTTTTTTEPESNECTVTFNTNGENGISSVTVPKGSKIKQPTIIPQKADDEQYSYQFTNWFTDEQCTNLFFFDTEITSSITLYAGYSKTVREFDVSFETNGGSTVKSLTGIKYGSKIEAPTEPTKPDDEEYSYYFAGWYLDEQLTKEFDFENSTITKATTLYAKWDRKLGNGYVKGQIADFSVYDNTDAYVQVSTAKELIEAINNAKCEYKTEWTYDTLTTEQQQKVTRYEELMHRRNDLGETLSSDEEKERTNLEAEIKTYTGSISQTLISEAKIHVIEITGDINLGFNKLDSETQKLVTSWTTKKTNYSPTSHLSENGVSQITISNVHNLLIYSKNGAKLTNGGFEVQECNGLVVKNIEMDEIWQWEDSPSTTPSFKVGDMDVFEWAYFKVDFSTNVWVDHCTFGKSYDGQIDVANPHWYNYTTYHRAPYGVDERDEKSKVSISNCEFHSGSDDKNGYLYKMMEEIEADYQKSKTDGSYSCQYLYYKTLRDTYNLSFDEILYGIAIPQKKAFLLGDSKESKKAESYGYNLNLSVSFLNDLFIDIEDRVPNVRGGIAYMANCVVDNSRYYQYRATLTNKGAKNISTVNSKYKLALVDQAIIGGYGASIRAENSLFIGVNELVKNNNDEKDTITNDQMRAGYSIINCIWYRPDKASEKTRIINTDTNPTQITASGRMEVSYFDWHNEENKQPFEVPSYVSDLHDLKNYLIETIKVGTNK